MPEVKKHVYTREVEKGLTHADTATFVDGIKDRSQFVQQGDEAETIHSTKFGVKPDVLINNTTYPIPIQQLDGDDYTLQLDKFNTLATPISDDELYAATYDKTAAVVESHTESISEWKFDKAAHALSPQTHSAATPVLLTTGADDGTGRKKLRKEDVIKLKKLADDQKWPKKGRRLTLCNDHIADLLELDQKFADQYHNYTSGKISDMYGFEIHEYVNCPFYTVATKTKKSFGATPVAGDMQASFAFVTSRAVKVTGSTKMYWSKAENDPQNQRNLVNFRHYYVVVPTAVACVGAIVSGIAQ